jgi:hypothetical protein
MRFSYLELAIMDGGDTGVGMIFLLRGPAL